jgi:uncharacterized protein
MITIILLFISNIFMTFAWYGHLKFKNLTAVSAIFFGWFIAFGEYCFQIPANRIGYKIFSITELKTIQEIITFVVFILFSIFITKESLRINHIIGFILIILGAYFIFKK